MRYTLRQRLVSLPGGAAARLPDGHRTDGAPGDAPLGEDVAYTPALVAPVPLHIVRTWDEEDRASAWDEAQRASARDPDAAAYLLTCLSSDGRADGADGERAQSATSGTLAPPRRRVKPFDPMRMIARVVKFYGFADADVMRMPWKRLLAYAREADIMTEEENKRYQEAQRGNGGSASSSDAAYRDMLPEDMRRAVWSPSAAQ